MRISFPLGTLALALGTSSLIGCAALADDASTEPRTVSIEPRYTYLIPRDGDHHHHGQPLLELNETEITLYHSPTPPSYWSIDIDDAYDPQHRRYPGLMALHVVFMSLAFFVALPAGIALRSVKHSLHGLAVMSFYGLCTLGCAFSALYSKLTPNMYEGAAHGKQGYFVIAISILLSAIDIIRLTTRLVIYVKSGEKFNVKNLGRTVVRRVDDALTKGNYSGVISEEPEQYPLVESRRQSSDYTLSHSDEEVDNTSEWANDVHRHHRRSYSHTSESTLVSPLRKNFLFSKRPSTTKIPPVLTVANIAFAALERILVFLGFMQVVTGVVTYTGGCRENYLNGCLAHLIKGGIFWCYGLVTFARFLGTFKELGWAWNRSPSGIPAVTAEMTESLVIFLYGITNTWMERWGASPGDPFTTKQIQHIGIAVMFWFAGLVGIAIESKAVRRLLSYSGLSDEHSYPTAAEAESSSYPWSFNPFPALVIGVTGAAMAAHAQTYAFQVSIHVLWGGMLLGFSFLRFATYFLIWLKPPKSVLPSRPPTEALGSFFLACGGLVFMMSTEELTIAAMRRGRDDPMMFLNVAVAFTCFAFCWVFVVVAFKAWIQSRASLTPQTPTSA